MQAQVAVLARRGVRAASTAANNALPSFSRALYQGKLESASVFPYPAATVLKEDQRETVGMLVEMTDRLLKEKNDPAANDATGVIPEETKAALREAGAYGMQVPEELEGAGLTNTGYARLVEVVGSQDLGLGIHLGSHQSIGYKGILIAGNEEQKKKYLPKLATGEHIAAFVLTEPGAGSDAAGIKTRATLAEDGKTWLINGSKIWISNGGFADVMTVFAKTEVTDPATGEKKDKITAFIVERNFGGVTSGPPEKKMGINCSNTTEVFFNNCPVPPENVLGEVGGGFKVAMAILNNGRFGMGAALSGTMKSLINGVIQHANQRKTFGKTLNEYELIQGKIATMVSRAYAVESLAFMLAANMDRGQSDYHIEAAVSKVLASDTAWFVSDEAIQIMGGLGYMRSLPYERVMRDLRIFRIFEGTNEILKFGVVGLMGLQDLGKAMEPLAKAAKSPLTNLGTLVPFGVQLLKERLGMVEKPSLAWAPAALRPAADVIENGTAGLAIAARNLLMKHGKKIIDNQFLVERAAEVVVDITAATAAASRAATALRDNVPTADYEVQVANLFAVEARDRINANLKAISGGHTQLNKARKAVAAATFSKGEWGATNPVRL